MTGDLMTTASHAPSDDVEAVPVLRTTTAGAVELLLLQMENLETSQQVLHFCTSVEGHPGDRALAMSPGVLITEEVLSLIHI